MSTSTNIPPAGKNSAHSNNSAGLRSTSSGNGGHGSSSGTRTSASSTNATSHSSITATLETGTDNFRRAGPATLRPNENNQRSRALQIAHAAASWTDAA